MKTTHTLFAALGVLAAVSCATTPVPRDLLDAKNLYDQEARTVTAQVNPAGLHEARRAIERADRELQKDPDSPETRDFSYVALRTTQLAAANAQINQAYAQKQQAERERLNRTEAELQATRGELEAARQSAPPDSAAESEREAREEQDKRVNDVADELGRISEVRRDERGVVLTLPGSELFASGKAALLPGAREKLDEVASVLVKAKAPGFVVEGYTDATGSEQANLDFSRRRAEAVRRYLVSRGVPAEQIRAQGKGEAAPVGGNDTEEGRANNRRVEIVLLKEPMASSK
jgi:outer membrane protein OmpA-like peptidoglycan-associated protein